MKHEEELGSGSYLDCFRASDNRIRFRTLSGIFLQAWQQLTGINFIFYFGTTFFTNAGIHNPYLISIATSTVNVGMTIPGIWGVERFGRRRLLLVGAIGMTICEYIIAIIGSTTSKSNQSAQSAEVAFVCFYISFFAATWGPIAWVITGEIFPLKVRAKAMSLATASNWLWNWAIAYSSESLLVSPMSVSGNNSDPILQRPTWSTLAPETQTSAPMSFTSGVRPVPAVSSLPTSAFPRQRVSLSSRSICCTRTSHPFTRSRTANGSSRKVPNSRKPRVMPLLLALATTMTLCHTRKLEVHRAYAGGIISFFFFNLMTSYCVLFQPSHCYALTPGDRDFNPCWGVLGIRDSTTMTISIKQKYTRFPLY